MWIKFFKIYFEQCKSAEFFPDIQYRDVWQLMFCVDVCTEGPYSNKRKTDNVKYYLFNQKKWGWGDPFTLS